jgi:UDP-3-O-[3-hydroxymyristoyl] glucosamine N-acyltransferase
VKAADLARLLGGDFRGEPDREIIGAAGLEDAGEGYVSFVADKKGLPLAVKSRASCFIVGEFMEGLDAPQIRVENPQLAFARVLGRLYAAKLPPAGVHELAFVAGGAEVPSDASVGAFAYIAADAAIGAGTVIYPGVFVGEGTTIGRDCLLYPNVVIREGVTVGDRVIIHPGAVIGADGFGYFPHEGRHAKMPQVGGVVIGDDVEIGACTTIDRATTGNTVIGSGTKIDNLVQVAHNVSIGEHSIVISQAGIAGSCKIGSGVVLGGQTGLADHLTIDDGVMLAARSGVMHDLKKGVYAGAPAVPRRDFMRATSYFFKLPELAAKIKALEEKLANIERSRGDD